MSSKFVECENCKRVWVKHSNCPSCDSTDYYPVVWDGDEWSKIEKVSWWKKLYILYKIYFGGY